MIGLLTIKRFYQVLFWLIFLMLIYIMLGFPLPIDIAKLKDIGLPLAAILFAIGTLWHKKEDQEDEKRKHDNEMNLAFRQIRWGYYSLLKEVVSNIIYLSGEDVMPKPEVEFKDTKYGKLWINLDNLENEGRVLFHDPDSISKKIILIREKMKEKADLLGKIYNKRQGLSTSPEINGNYIEDITLLSSEIKEIDDAVKNTHEQCRENIFSYLRPPIIP